MDIHDFVKEPRFSGIPNLCTYPTICHPIKLMVRKSLGTFEQRALHMVKLLTYVLAACHFLDVDVINNSGVY